MLGFALFAACLYGAFAEGAIRAPDEPRLQVAIAIVSALAAGAWLWLSKLTLSVPRVALGALALLTAFTAWSMLTLLWSASPDGTWVEVNRAFTYTAVLTLAIAFGASARGAIDLAAKGLLALVLIVTVYALAQKLVPGLRIGGLIDLDQTGQFARLQAPLDYWNALALLVGLGAPVALTFALQVSASPRTRLTGLVGLELIVVTIGFGESRGGFVALVVGLAAIVLLSPDRLTALMWAVTATAAGALDLVIGLLAHPLTGDGVALHSRELAGLYLLIVLVAVAVLSALAIPSLDAVAANLTRRWRRRAWRALGYGSVAAIVLALAAAALSHRGLGGQISRIWGGFNNADSIATSSAARLFSDSSANRVDWWGQALRAFVSRPLGGYGAGSFDVVNLLFRHDTVSVQDAHSVPLQWLAETGLVGFLLAGGAWILLLRGGLRAVWRAGGDRVDPTRMDTAPARRRLAAAALLAAALAYSVHALYDWDWDIPGVTLPVLIVLGVLGGSLAGPPVERPTVVIVPAPLVIRRELTPLVRLSLLAAIVAGMCLFAVSAVLPGLAADKADAALSDAARGGVRALAQARREAGDASSLDPLSGAGPLANANIAVAEGAPALAREYVVEALDRQPTDLQAWETLARIDLQLGRDGESLTAVRRALALDPLMSVSGVLTLEEYAITAQLNQAPPQDSATAVQTPGS